MRELGHAIDPIFKPFFSIIYIILSVIFHILENTKIYNYSALDILCFIVAVIVFYFYLFKIIEKIKSFFNGSSNT